MSLFVADNFSSNWWWSTTIVASNTIVTSTSTDYGVTTYYTLASEPIHWDCTLTRAVPGPWHNPRQPLFGMQPRSATTRRRRVLRPLPCGAQRLANKRRRFVHKLYQAAP